MQLHCPPPGQNGYYLLSKVLGTWLANDSADDTVPERTESEMGGRDRGGEGREKKKPT